MKKKTEKILLNKSREIYDSNISYSDIAVATEEDMKIFGANINILRNVPLLVDGLKPVERRILYTMYSEMGSRPNKAFDKVGDISGRVMAIFHPHGQFAIEEAVAKMAQFWNNGQTSIEIKGNYGSADGTKAGSGRYIKARLSEYGYKCFFEDFDINIVDSVLSYNEKELEPLFLPARYPNVLVNNTFGIGFGLSTGIPTFNLKEAFELTIRMLTGDVDPEKDFLYPDLSSGADLIDEGQFPSLFLGHKGKFRSRAHIEKDYERNVLVIKSLPMFVTMKSVLETITKAVKDNKLPYLKDIKEYELPKPEEMLVELYFKQEADLDDMYYKLIKMTRLENTTSVNFSLIDNFKPIPCNLYNILNIWIDFRKELKTRAINRSLVKTYERLHILEVLLFIFNKDNAEQTLKLIKSANNKKDIVDKLIAKYNIDSLKAKSIADMKMYEFSKESREGFAKEYKDKEKVRDDLIKGYKDKNIVKSMISELEEGIELFGQPRRSMIIVDDGAPVIKDSDHLLVFTRKGYIKKLPDNIKDIGFVNNDDQPDFILKMNNRTELLLFDSYGRVSKLSVSEIPNSILSKPGTKLEELNILSKELVSILVKPTNEDIKKMKGDIFLLIATAKGLIKKIKMDTFFNIRKGSSYISLSDDDIVVDVVTMIGDNDIVVYGERGYGIKFNTSTFSDTGRTAKGIPIMTMTDDDKIIGIDILSDKDKYLLIVTNKGYVKKCDINSLIDMRRNTKPVIFISLDKDDTIYRAISARDKEEYKVVQPSGSTVIVVDDLLISTRLAKGRKLIPVKRGDDIVDISLIEKKTKKK